MNRLTQRNPISQWQRYDEKQSLPSEWTLKLNLTICPSHHGRRVGFLGCCIKNQFLGNLMHLVWPWSCPSLPCLSPVHWASGAGGRQEVMGPLEEPGLKGWTWHQVSEDSPRGRAPARTHCPPEPRVCIPSLGSRHPRGAGKGWLLRPLCS